MIWALAPAGARLDRGRTPAPSRREQLLGIGGGVSATRGMRPSGVLHGAGVMRQPLRLRSSAMRELEEGQPLALVGLLPAGGYATFLVPAVFILVLQQTLLIGMGTLRVAERHSPIGDSGPVWARLGGIVTVLLVLYLLEAAVMFLVAAWLYGLPLRADLPTAAVFLIPFITASILLGLAIGELFERPESSTVALALTSVPALFLSGISFPLENQAAWVRAIGLALPTTFGIRGFVQIGEMGATLVEAWRSWGALWLQTLIYGLIAAYLMSQRRAGQRSSWRHASPPDRHLGLMSPWPGRRYRSA